MVSRQRHGGGLTRSSEGGSINLQCSLRIERPGIEAAGPLRRRRAMPRQGATPPRLRRRTTSLSVHRLCASASSLPRAHRPAIPQWAIRSRQQQRVAVRREVGVPSHDVRQHDRDRDAVRDAVARGQRIGAGVRRAEHRCSIAMPARTRRAASPRAARSSARRAPARSAPSSSRHASCANSVRERRAPRGDGRLDRVRDRVEAGDRRHRCAAA